MKKEKFECKLCGAYFENKDMSEEHYPARSTGNEDGIDIKYSSIPSAIRDITYNVKKGKISYNELFNTVEDYVSIKKYPNGRTSRTLCRNCNTFLGKYDEAYLKFFNTDGESKKIKGFTKGTKLNIIKAIYGKFLSLPEAREEKFDFLEFIKDEKIAAYNGKWNLYLVKRDNSTKLLGLPFFYTDRVLTREGVYYIFSDEKFIYFLMNFKPIKEFEMTNIFDILQKNYKITTGVGSNGGYLATALIYNLTTDK